MQVPGIHPSYASALDDRLLGLDSNVYGSDANLATSPPLSAASLSPSKDSILRRKRILRMTPRATSISGTVGASPSAIG